MDFTSPLSTGDNPDLSPKQARNAKRRRTATSGSNPTGRALVACSTCRDRKTRCSGEQPACTFCKRSGILCVYPKGGSGGPLTPLNLPTSLDEWGSKILGAIDQLAARLSNPSAAYYNQQDDSTSDLASRRSILALAMQASPDADSHVDSLPQNGMASSYSDEDTMGDENVIEFLSLRRSMAHPENPPFGMWWSYTIEETLSWPILEFQGNISTGLDALMDSDGEDMDFDDGRGSEIADLGASRTTTGRKQFRHATRSLDDDATVLDLIENFLKHAHTMNPILESTTLRKHAANMIEHGLKWDGETCQVLLACAIGAIADPWNVSVLTDFSHPKTSPAQLALGQEYFNAAQKRLGNLWSHCSLLSAQCLFMTGVFLLYTQEPVAGWRALNSASVACRSYISKRVARRNQGLPMPESQSIEKRLCWSCIKSEREIAVEFGMETSGLNLIANSTSLPTPPNGYVSNMGRNTTVQNPGADSAMLSDIPSHYENQSWYYYLTEIMLQKVEMRIDNYNHEKRREAYRRANDSPESFFRSMVHALKEFDYQLTLYYESLPSVLQFPLDDLTPCTDELRHYLRWRVYSVRHDITLPALYILLHNDTVQWSRDLVQDLVQLANVCLSLDEKFLSMAISTHRSQATWLGPRKGVRSALIIIATARLKAQHIPGLETLDVPEAALWGEGGEMLMRGLRYWSKESRDCKVYMNMLRQMHPAFR